MKTPPWLHPWIRVQLAVRDPDDTLAAAGCVAVDQKRRVAGAGATGAAGEGAVVGDEPHIVAR